MLRGYVLILWGNWGDSSLSLMYQGLHAPHMIFLCGESPHKIRGATPGKPTKKHRQNWQK